MFTDLRLFKWVSLYIIDKISKNVQRLKKLITSKTKGGFSYEFAIYKIASWPSGLWPLEKPNLFNHARYLIAISSQLFMLLTVIVEIYKKCGTVADVLEYWALTIVFILSLARLIFVRIHFEKVYDNCSSAQKNWSNITNPDLRNIMIGWAKTGKMFYHAQMTIAYFLLAQYIMNPVILQRKDATNLPVQTVCTFANLSSVGYMSIYFVESVGYVYLAYGLIGLDVLFYGVAMHLCGQLGVLQMQFNRIGESMHHAECIRRVKLLSRKYSEVMKLARDIGATYSPILLIHFVMSTFLITSQSVTFLLAMKVGNYFLAVKCAQSFPILFLELFLYCYVGELLKCAFADISQSIYSSYWYLLPPKIRRDYLLFNMAQSGRSFNLTAGKIIRVNMRTFIKFVRSMVSFFSIMFLMFDK